MQEASENEGGEVVMSLDGDGLVEDVFAACDRVRFLASDAVSGTYEMGIAVAAAVEDGVGVVAVRAVAAVVMVNGAGFRGARRWGQEGGNERRREY